MSIQNLKKKAFKNSEVKTEYDLLESEFSRIDALLSMRKKSGLTQVGGRYKIMRMPVDSKF